MCTTADFRNVIKIPEDIIAYKVVSERLPGQFSSEYTPRHRSDQPGFSTAGKDRRYVVGKMHKSTLRSTPGFYCFRSLIDAQDEIRHTGRSILEVTIPAGTKIVEGKTGYCKYGSVNCEKLAVVRLVQ